MSGTVKVDIVGAGAFLQTADSDQPRPYQTGDTIEVDAAVADRLIADGVAVPAGEAPPEQDAQGISGDYASHPKDDLQAEADRRGLEVEGTGADGNVVKDDLVDALEADDAA